MFARGLEQPTRTASSTSPCGVIAFATSPRCRPYSVLLPVGFAVPSPLPETRCALTAPFHPCLAEARRFVLCGTFPGVAPAGCYPAPYVDGARTFLSGRLSTLPERPSGRLTRQAWRFNAAASRLMTVIAQARHAVVPAGFGPGRKESSLT